MIGIESDCFYSVETYLYIFSTSLDMWIGWTANWISQLIRNTLMKQNPPTFESIQNNWKQLRRL